MRSDKRPKSRWWGSSLSVPSRHCLARETSSGPSRHLGKRPAMERRNFFISQRSQQGIESKCLTLSDSGTSKANAKPI